LWAALFRTRWDGSELIQADSGEQVEVAKSSLPENTSADAETSNRALAEQTAVTVEHGISFVAELARGERSPPLSPLPSIRLWISVGLLTRVPVRAQARAHAGVGLPELGTTKRHLDALSSGFSVVSRQRGASEAYNQLLSRLAGVGLVAGLLAAAGLQYLGAPEAPGVASAANDGCGGGPLQQARGRQSRLG
jgi:hypothetical protein